MLNVSMVFTPEQFLTFRTFFNNSVANPVLPGVAHGSSRLNFPDPMWFPSTGETEEDRPTVECRFMIESGGQPYNAVPDGDSRDWRVSFVLEVLPSA